MNNFALKFMVLLSAYFHTNLKFLLGTLDQTIYTCWQFKELGIISILFSNLQRVGREINLLRYLCTKFMIPVLVFGGILPSFFIWNQLLIFI